MPPTCEGAESARRWYHYIFDPTSPNIDLTMRKRRPDEGARLLGIAGLALSREFRGLALSTARHAGLKRGRDRAVREGSVQLWGDRPIKSEAPPEGDRDEVRVDNLSSIGPTRHSRSL
jgi:hypothetical protein